MSDTDPTAHSALRPEANGYRPDVPIAVSPLLNWPPRPLATLLHVRWLYDHAHYLHHYNVNTGPFSGLSMHPVEHVFYFSMVVLWWVVPADPFIVILTGMANAVPTAMTHSGFERYEIGKREGRTVSGSDYFHHLHHRYFECNYGLRPVPFDKLFGTFHDGTDEAHARMRQRMKARRGAQTGKAASTSTP